MPENNIKSRRTDAGLSATALADMLPEGIGKVAMSFIESGKVLPTRANLEKICELLNCKPTDLYEAREIDLLSIGRSTVELILDGRAMLEQAPAPPEEKQGRMEQVRVWMQAEEKAALMKVIKALGYQSLAEWMREMYRSTLERYIMLQLNGGGTVPASVPETPTTTQNQTIATAE